MKKAIIGILAIALVFGMAVIGCDDNDDPPPPSSSTGGGTGTSTGTGTPSTIIVTGIPAQYIGKFAYMAAENDDDSVELFGGYYNDSTDSMIAIPVSDGSVTLPVWTDDRPPVRYYGNHILDYLWISIFDSEDVEWSSPSFLHDHSFTNIKFTNGSTIIDWSMGTPTP